MNVLHIAHVTLPNDHPCGPSVAPHAFHPGRWVLDLAKAQKQHTDILPEILIKVPGSKKHWKTVIEGIPCHFVPVLNFLRGKTGFFCDQRILSKAALSLAPDLVHAHGTEEANALAALRTRLPCTLTLQGCYFIINRRIAAKFFSRPWIVERLEKGSIPRFHHIITKSRYIQHSVQSLFPQATTHLIPNTYDSSLESIQIGSPRGKTLAYVGSIDSRKGVDLIVSALELITQKSKIENKPNNFSLPILHVFGNHADGKTAYEIVQISRLKALLGNRLHLHGIANQLEMSKIIATCQALLAPSREEMFGNQVIEALLVGTHVIVTEETAMAENVMRFGNGTIIPQEDPIALSKAIISTLKLSIEDKVPTDAAEARSRVLAYMGPEVVAKKHRDLYFSVLRDRGILSS